jgi:hypothetical protein
MTIPGPNGGNLSSGYLADRDGDCMAPARSENSTDLETFLLTLMPKKCVHGGGGGVMAVLAGGWQQVLEWGNVQYTVLTVTVVSVRPQYSAPTIGFAGDGNNNNETVRNT